jgi:general stress protein YciG
MANTSKRGFASMDAAKQREIASKGGRAAHAKGTAHEFTSDEARVAGRKGGEAVSRDRQHMSNIGREGGHSRGARARAAAQGGGSDLGEGRSAEQTFERQANTERSGFERSTGDINRPINNNTERSPERDRGSFAAQDRTSSSSPRNDSQSENNPYSGRGNI